MDPNFFLTHPLHLFRSPCFFFGLWVEKLYIINHNLNHWIHKQFCQLKMFFPICTFNWFYRIVDYGTTFSIFSFLGSEIWFNTVNILFQVKTSATNHLLTVGRSKLILCIIYLNLLAQDFRFGVLILTLCQSKKLYTIIVYNHVWIILMLFPIWNFSVDLLWIFTMLWKVLKYWYN